MFVKVHYYSRKRERVEGGREIKPYNDWVRIRKQKEITDQKNYFLLNIVMNVSNGCIIPDRKPIQDIIHKNCVLTIV